MVSWHHQGRTIANVFTANHPLKEFIYFLTMSYYNVPFSLRIYLFAAMIEDIMVPSIYTFGGHLEGDDAQ